MNYMITVSHLNKWYNQVIALNDVTMQVPPGITGLLGPNGAGKTTLLRVLAGMIKPSSGVVRIFGESPWNNLELLRHIGYCPDHDTLYEFMSGYSFLVTLMRLRGFPWSQAKPLVEEAVEVLGLGKVIKRKIYTYSKGMRQRLKLAQSIMHRPELLLLDEPLLGTDPLIRSQISDLLAGMGKGGKTVIISSHVLHEVETLTQHIVILNQGRLIASGKIDQIRDMVEGSPYTIIIRTPHVRKLAGLLIDETSVTAVYLVPGKDELQVKTLHPTNFYHRFVQLTLQHKLSIKEMISPDDQLEAIYQYLVRT
jgi:ABC-2 type transport system ATP-binding protein